MEKTGLKIKLLGDPALRKKASCLRKVTPQHRRTLSLMAQLMYENSGIGLAASQIGISEAMIVVDIGKGLYKLINPQIVKRQGKMILQEGCLSVPGICVNVRRAKKILLEALDVEGNPLTIEAEDLLACVFQHEIDHLRGKLIIDHASILEKIKLKKKIEKIKKSAASYLV